MILPRRAVGTALALAFVAACSSQTIRGSGTLVERTLALGADVTRVAVAGTFEVEISVGGGDAPSATVTADDNLIDRVRFGVSGDTLTIRLASGTPVEDATLRATVAMPDLRRLAVAGASVVEVEGTSSDTLEAGVSGASTVTLTDASLRFLTLDVDGSSLVAAEGTAASLDATANGASSLELAELQATDAVLHLDGASSATVSASSTLDVTASGASSVLYTVAPTQLTEWTSGGSTVAPLGG